MASHQRCPQPPPAVQAIPAVQGSPKPDPSTGQQRPRTTLITIRIAEPHYGNHQIWPLTKQPAGAPAGNSLNDPTRTAPSASSCRPSLRPATIQADEHLFFPATGCPKSTAEQTLKWATIMYQP
ncbi:hypothetical protein ACLOJK_019110 [Asimina triloba]